jgi:hypothetical protein
VPGLPQGLPPIRLSSSPRVMPDGARNAAIWSSSTGSGRTRRASPAASGKPVLRKRQSEMLPGVLHRHHQARAVLLATSACWESAGVKVDAHRQRIGARRR